MQFRLVYQGKLPAASNSGGGTRTQEKHEIRRELHKQLRTLWFTDPFLKVQIAPKMQFGSGFTEEEKQQKSEAFEKLPTPASRIADNFARCGYRFLPLIGSTFKWGMGGDYSFTTACAIEILFLRRDEPGDLVHGGGDIDNRVKTLFDGLRMPQNCSELKGFIPTPDEDPFFCLLEDDKLITSVSVTTDRLLAPLDGSGHVNDVHLVIHVRTMLTGAIIGAAAFS